MQLSIHPWKLETKDNLVRRNRSITANESLAIVSANKKRERERETSFLGLRLRRKGKKKKIKMDKIVVERI